MVPQDISGKVWKEKENETTSFFQKYNVLAAIYFKSRTSFLEYLAQYLLINSPLFCSTIERYKLSSSLIALSSTPHWNKIHLYHSHS